MGLFTRASPSGLWVGYGHRILATPPRGFCGSDAKGVLTTEQLSQFLQAQTCSPALSYHEFRERLASGAPAGEGWLMTFDDGFRDTLTHALPVLERYQVPVVVFLVAGFLTREATPYQEYLAGIVRNGDAVNMPEGERLTAVSAADKQVAYERCRKRIKKMSPEARQRWLERLGQANGEPPSVNMDKYLDVAEARELADHPLVTIGAHTVTHPYLPSVPGRQLREELEDGRRRLEALIGQPVPCLAYPHGGQSLRVRRFAKRAGYEMAFATDERPLPAKGLDRYRIPRMAMDRLIPRHAAEPMAQQAG